MTDEKTEFEELSKGLIEKGYEEYVLEEVLSKNVLESIEDLDTAKLCESFIKENVDITRLFIDNDTDLKNFKYGIYLIKACCKYESTDILDFLILQMGTNNGMSDSE